ncbi:hypothetical protein, partial [Streptomyces sp. NPDC051554]|uniref:hypothetical protein n=1 Tax=Streptomyces sp. NPDC051554 TaxID=3365656 RepID=UPI0037B16B24
DINCTQGVLKDNSLWGSAGPDTITITRDGVFAAPGETSSSVVAGSVDGRGGDDDTITITITITANGTTLVTDGAAGTDTLAGRRQAGQLRLHRRPHRAVGRGTGERRSS